MSAITTPSVILLMCMAERWASFASHGQHEKNAAADVKCRVYTPSTLRTDAPDILYLPGLFTNAESNSTTLIAQTFAEKSGSLTYAMSAEMHKVSKNTSQLEAQEILKRFHEVRAERGDKKRKPLIIVGHSHGGDVGISVTKRLEEQNIPVAGLILLNTRGLSDEHSVSLAVSAKDEIERTAGVYFKPPRILQPDKNPSMRKNVRDLITDLKSGIRRDVFSWKIANKIDACSYINPDAAGIKTNIEIILGADDVLAHPSHIIPSDNNDPHIINWSERADYLRRNIFKKSKRISVHVAKHGGVHALPVLRPDTVARVALVSLDRMHESQRKRSSPIQIFPQAA